MTVIIANPIKNPRKRLIQLKKVGTRWMDVRELSQQLIEGLGDEVFNYQTRTTFLFHILKQFSSISRTLEPIDDSIERACGKVLKHFGLDRTTKVKVLTKTGNHEVSRKPKSKTEEFCQTILGIVKPPSIAYRELLSLVTGDLQSLTKLIQWYEEQTIIRKYLKSQEQPRNHHDKMIYDFYLRCTNERIEILNYQLNGLKKRAIEKSKYRPNWISGLLWSEDLYDRPYHFARPFSMPYFDCQRIDLSGHRISEFYLDEAVKLQNLYSENKVKFYRLYFIMFPIVRHSHGSTFLLSTLPLR
ncbi:MAG: hypothetical protein GY816_11265, partial [Cytophagales bacterium]|nr:hypothetical protein [Cytophagales bacterium]